MPDPPVPQQININPAPSFDPNFLMKNGYKPEEVQFIQNGLKNGYSIQDIDKFLANPELNAKAGRPVDAVIDFLRPMISGGAASLAGGASGPFAPIAAPAAYAGVDALLQKLRTNPDQSFTSQAIGAEPGSASDLLANSAQQFILGKVLQKGVTDPAFRGAAKLLQVGKTEFEKLMPTTAQALEQSGAPKIITTPIKAIEDIAATGSKRAAQERSGTAAVDVATDMANKMAGRRGLGVQDPITMIRQMETDIDNALGQSGAYKRILAAQEGRGPSVPIRVRGADEMQYMTEQGIPTHAVDVAGPPRGALPEFNTSTRIDALIRNPDELQKVLTKIQQEGGTTDNFRQSLKGYSFMKMFNDAITRDPRNPSLVNIDPKTLTNAWTDPNMLQSYKTIFSQQNRADIAQFFKNVAITQDKMSTMPIAKPLVLMHGGAMLAGSMLTGHLTTGAGMGTAAMAGLFVPAWALGKLLTKPSTARLMVALAGGEPLGMSDQMASKILAQALQGASVAVVNDKGQRIPATIQGGGIQPLPEGGATAMDAAFGPAR